MRGVADGRKAGDRLCLSPPRTLKIGEAEKTGKGKKKEGEKEEEKKGREERREREEKRGI